MWELLKSKNYKNMKLLIDQWNYYKDIIDKREDQYVKSIVHSYPENVYSVYNNGNLRVMAITSVEYNNRKYFSFDKRPTKKHVDAIKEFAESIYEFKQENIYFHWKEGNSSSAFPLKDLATFLSKEDAENKSQLRKSEIANEEELLKNGHTRCQYCRKVVPDNQIVTDTIIGRGRRQVFNSWKGIMESKACITQEPMKFCSGQCAGNEQMSREG